MNGGRPGSSRQAAAIRSRFDELGWWTIHRAVYGRAMVRREGPTLALQTLKRAALAIGGCLFVGSLALWRMGVRGGGRLLTLPARPPFLDMWMRWDGGWYTAIAARGYGYDPAHQSPVVFFPLYPLAIRGLAWLGLDPWLAGILITVAFGLLGLGLFAHWARELAGEEASSLATLLMIVWPFALYLYGAVYSDALYLTLAVGAFYLLERGHPFGSAAAGALAAATRPVAPALVLGLLVRSLELRLRRHERVRVRDLAPALSGLGTAAYMAYLWWQFRDPLLFLKAQAAWGQLSGWDALVKRWLWSRPFDERAIAIPQAALALGLLALAWPMRKKLGWGYSVYVALVVGIPILVSRDFIGLGRYGIAGFPSVLMLAVLLMDRPRLRTGWLWISAAALGFMAYRMAVGLIVA